MSRVARILIEKDVPIPLRDGTLTVGDLYRPADGTPVPALVTRNPYNKEVELRAVGTLPSPGKLAERGYAVVSTDVRGRFGSEGTFTPFQDEGPDGYDTIEWTAAQPWCDGNVGAYGPSYLGVTTLLAARERPPSLRCAIPLVTVDDYYRDWVYQGGAFKLSFALGWALGIAMAGARRLDAETRERLGRRSAASISAATSVRSPPRRGSRWRESRPGGPSGSSTIATTSTGRRSLRRATTRTTTFRCCT